MKKIKLLGMGNDHNMNYLIVKKRNDFFSLLSQFFDSFGRVPIGVQSYDDPDNNFETKKKKMKDFVDIHEFYLVDKIRFDIFYGKNKIFILFNCTSKKRKVLMLKLKKISEFVKYKGSYKFPMSVSK